MKYDYVVIDFEYADSRQFACQLGIVPVLKGAVVDKIEYLIQPPENKYGAFEMEKHRITPEMTRNAPAFNVIWDDIEMYFSNQTLVCHGKETDVQVLKKTLGYYSIDIPSFEVIDTKTELVNKPLSLLCEAYEVEYTEKHNALNDALALAEVFIKFKNNHKIDISVLNKPTNNKTKTLFADKKFNPELSKKNLEIENKDNPFYNKTVVVTGNFVSSREAVKEKFYNLGADNNGSISKNTNFVFVGTGAGPAKLKKIQELQDAGIDIKVFTVDELESVMNDNFEFLKN